MFSRCRHFARASHFPPQPFWPNVQRFCTCINDITLLQRPLPCLGRMAERVHDGNENGETLFAQVFLLVPDLRQAVRASRGFCERFRGLHEQKRRCLKGNKCPFLHEDELVIARHRCHAPFLQLTQDNRLLVMPPLKKVEDSGRGSQMVPKWAKWEVKRVRGRVSLTRGPECW